MAIYCTNLFLYPSNTIDRNESCLNYMLPVNMQVGHRPMTHMTHPKNWPIWPIDPWPMDPLFTLLRSHRRNRESKTVYFTFLTIKLINWTASCKSYYASGIIMKYTFHYAAASPLAAPHTLVSSHARVNRGRPTYNATQSAKRRLESLLPPTE